MTKYIAFTAKLFLSHGSSSCAKIQLNVSVRRDLSCRWRRLRLLRVNRVICVWVITVCNKVLDIIRALTLPLASFSVWCCSPGFDMKLVPKCLAGFTDIKYSRCITIPVLLLPSFLH